MKQNNKLSPFKRLGSDIPASIVVFLVALPLCLGIALASGASPLSGVIAGIIGGIVVGSLSNSAIGVSGPAAGLIGIVVVAIPDLGGFQYFLVAVIIAGILQLILGFVKAGFIAYFFPTSVVHGMLSGIGVVIILKEIPHAIGYDKDPVGDESFAQTDHQNMFSELWHMLDYVNLSVVIVSLVAIFLILFWNSKIMKNFSFTKVIPAALIAVLAGVGLNEIFANFKGMEIVGEHLVKLPMPRDAKEFFSNFIQPNFTILSNIEVYKVGFIIALVASVETLLCVEATDKIDPLKRVTDTNKELKAQGVGNILSGLIGGLPITQVIVRSSANIQAGGVTKASAVLHGFILLLSIILAPSILNLIPQGALAAVLILVGIKLVNFKLIKKTLKEGWEQYVPFLITIIAMQFGGMLIGIGMGLAVAIIVILFNNFKFPLKIIIDKRGEKDCHCIKLSENVTFLNKASLLNTLIHIPNDSVVVVDASGTHFIHHDVLEIIEDFQINAQSRSIEVELIDLDLTNKNNPLTHINLKVIKE